LYDLEELNKKLELLSGLIDAESRPRLSVLASLARDLDIARLNTKFFGYELANRLAAELSAPVNLTASRQNLCSKTSTQSDFEKDWFAFWCSELRMGRIYHRKIWEVCYLLQALYDHDLIAPGKTGLGFGVGTEVIPAYLAGRGIAVMATDLPPSDVAARGWLNTNQWTADRERLHFPQFVKREDFDKLIGLRYVDMNEIPSDLVEFDFCWSLCALEHLGTIAKGLHFIENSIATLRLGGIAVHTTEFNFFNEHETIDNWSTVLFQRRHFEEIAARLTAKGHIVRPLDFDIGKKPLDRFIDVPPYSHQWDSDVRTWWGCDDRHIKLSIDGFACTSFGLIIQRGGT
jgi:hypothetical protein